MAAAIVLKGLGGLLFIFGSSLGAYLLVCISLHTSPCLYCQINQNWKNWCVCYRLAQLLHQAFATPILYDFYNYDVEQKEYTQHFLKFTQVRIFVPFEMVCQVEMLRKRKGGGGSIFFPVKLLINLSFLFVFL